jgi:16S rRNA (guanine966-N2)-methyltransferase
LRIISGKARGTRLSTFSGCNIRPTSDRVREAIFSILYSRMGDLSGRRVLDLFAGSGAMAFEALSRGADHATLIDSSRQAARTIQVNAESCRLGDRIRFLLGSVPALLPRLAEEPPFDLIFLDPPYDQGLLTHTLILIADLDLLTPKGLICAEGSLRETVADAMSSLSRVDSRRYGQTAVHLFTYPEEGDAEE